MTLTITSIDEPDAKTQLAASMELRVKPETSEKLRAKALRQPRDALQRFAPARRRSLLERLKLAWEVIRG